MQYKVIVLALVLGKINILNLFLLYFSYGTIRNSSEQVTSIELCNIKYIA